MAEDPDAIGSSDAEFLSGGEVVPDASISINGGGEGSGGSSGSSVGLMEDVAPVVSGGAGRGGRGRITLALGLLVCVAAVGGFLFGYDTGVIGGALYFLNEERKLYNEPVLSSFMNGLIPAATPFGAVFGSLCGGALADRYGRKPSVMLASVVFTLGAGIMAFSPDLWVLVAGRFIVGLAVGLVSMVVPIYLSESSPEMYRGAVVSMNILFVTGGQFISYAVDLWLAQVQFQWRWMLGVSAIPAILQFFGMLFLSETPRWLVSRGLLADAKRVLTALHGDSAVASRDVREICIAVKSEPQGTVGELFTGVGRRSLLISCGVLVLQQVCAINTVMYYIPFILANSGVAPDDVPLWSLLPAGMNALGTIVGIVLVDRIGRRLLLLSSVVGVTFSLLTFALVNRFATAYSIYALVLYLLCFSPGLGPVPWAIASEVFPVKVRGIGMAFATASNWLSNFVISVSFPSLTELMGLSNAMLGYMALSALTFIFVYFVVPETKNKTLEEVQTMLRENPYPVTRFTGQRKFIKV